METGAFLTRLGLSEEPMGVYYTDTPPADAFSPKSGVLPDADAEARGTVDWGAVFRDFSCVMGHVWRARKKGAAACFDRERFGCLGGAFYLGFLKPQLDFIAHYVSTGIPGQTQGERYLESPEATRRFFEAIDPRPAPARFCVIQPVGRFRPGQVPELVVFFARGEVMCGLNQLATFVTNDYEAVVSPFGAGCASMVTWPLKYLAQGKQKAVLGGWDPSDRKFFRPDEITFTIPYSMFRQMALRWRESFLTTPTWEIVLKKIRRSQRTWGEGTEASHAG